MNTVGQGKKEESYSNSIKEMSIATIAVVVILIIIFIVDWIIKS